MPRFLDGLGPQPLRSMPRQSKLPKRSRYRELIRTHGMKLLPGVANWVHRLHDAGWLQAIASSAPRPNIDIVVEAFGAARFFQAIVSAEDVRIGKPDPEVFLKA